MFDREMRKRDLVESDFHKYNTTDNIEITVCVNISDNADSDSQKLIAKLKGAIQSGETDVYIKLIAKFNNQNKMADIQLFWGGNIDNLTEMSLSTTYFPLDNVFNVIYINSYVDIQELFKRNIRKLIVNSNDNAEADKTAEQNIKQKMSEINSEIAKMSGVMNFSDKLTPSYKKMRDDNVSISVKSDFAINSLYSNIVPYIRRDDDENEYPTSGEGRKKLLAYSVYSILSDDTADKMINIFRIEEPETNLHRAMQSALSHFLFDIDANDNKLKYLFISTHSPYILSDMDDVNLVRIFNENKITSKSEFYSVPTEWKNVKKKLNRTLSEAIFADAVLLVEGESECILFERVLSEIDPYYESKGNYILSVEGIGFKPYIDIFKTLEIKYVLKTDNDMKKVKDSNPALYYPLGLERINGILKFINVTDCVVLPVNKNLSEANLTIKARRLLYDKNKDSLDKIREKFNIYLSHCSLEEDILECLRNQRFIELLNKNTSEEALKYLKSKKQHRMVELVGKLNPDDCKKIYDHYNFACLKAVCV